MKSHILTFDLGTTYFKAVVFAPDGEVCAVRRCPTPITKPSPGFSEIAVNAFDAAITELTDGLREDDPQAWGAVGRISFATQTNSFVLLDENDQPVTPIIVWNDERADGMTIPDYNDLLETGIPSIGPSFSPSKMLWLQQQAPDAWQRAKRFALIGDLLTHRFTDRHATEAGAAGLTGLLNIHTLAWRDSAMSQLGLSDLKMPDVMRAGQPLGRITDKMASALSLPPTCEFFMGCLDQYAGAVAAELLEHGGVSETTGTVLATVTASDHFDPSLAEQGVFQGPSAKAGWYYRMVFGSTSANLLAEFRNQQPDAPSYETLDAEAAAFLANPDDDSNQRGGEVVDIYRAVADALNDQVQALCSPHLPSLIYSLGGAAQSDCWRQQKHAATGIEIKPLDCVEPTSWGAGLLTEK